MGKSMRFEKKEPRWREWLSEDEARTVAEIDAQVEAGKLRLAERARIANRAIQRARYRDQKSQA